MKSLLLLLCAAFLAPTLALAQWQWVDKDGRRVFSDRPPPMDVPANKILRQPGQRKALTIEEARAAAPASAASEAPRPAAAASGPRVSGQDRALQEKKKLQDAADAQKKRDEEQKMAAARAENCERSVQAKASLQSGARIAITNDKGEREFMDDRQRASEVARLDTLIARDCR